jgi:rubrerythrin
MELRTASAVVGFAERLETGAAGFYEAAASLFPDLAGLFRELARENAKNTQSVKRAYYSVISDALETGFSFQNLLSEPYEIETAFPANAGAAEILALAVANETKMGDFYRQAAECSQAFLADLPRVFKRMAANREKRLSRLRERLPAAGGLSPQTTLPGR